MLGKVKAGLGDKLAAVFPEVTSHTPIEMVRRGLDVFHQAGADALVTVGGGSAIDAGKAMALMLATGRYDSIQVVLAWVFVATRCVHAFIHIGFNYVPLRFAAFFAGFAA